MLIVGVHGFCAYLSNCIHASNMSSNWATSTGRSNIPALLSGCMGLPSVPASKPIGQTPVPARDGGSWPPRAPVARKQLPLIVYVEHACVCLWLSGGQNSPCGDGEIMLKSTLKMKEVPNGTLDCRCSPCCGVCHLQKQDHSRAY